MSKKLLSIVMAAAMLFSLAGCGSDKKAEVHELNIPVGAKEQPAEEVNPVEEETPIAEYEELLSGTYAVLISVENYGDIFVELDADAAPITVTNFMKLVNEDYYSGLTFHRIISGFMMQGGQSKEKPAANITGEFAFNGIDNPISHKRGVISMARANDPNSANSQFFICHQDSEFLDGQYAAFGHVVSGMEVVDKICEEAIVVDDNGTVLPENQPIITGIYDVTAEYRSDALGEAGFVPSNEFEEIVGRDTFESYDEIISLLPEGMAYGYADVLGADEPVLFVNTSGLYDNGEGNMAALDATAYIKQADGTFRSFVLPSSEGTAYPISTLDGIIYTGGNHCVSGDCISDDNDNPGIMAMFYLYVSYDEDANATYGGFIRDTNSVLTEGIEVAEDDDKPLEEAFKAYEKATPVYFTVVE